ncbi:hypothetical protein LSM04_003484 [Trypanosoma melophagium]|uniref:uncharacterized protein n=1 Tax=Trypanosoma melophagium TaxID=715481 RepID=UPI00351AAA8D|nr:hypothetical protein LSM04_003484 [Trypanosoma melophagium]
MGLISHTPRVAFCVLVFFCVVLLFTANWIYFNGVGGYISPVVEPADDAQTPSPGVPSVFAFDAAQDTLRLTEAEQQRVAQLQARVVSFNRNGSHLVCPERYIFAHFRHAGRHHNQLQMMMNIIMWAERLNRTAVFGSFYVKNKFVHYHLLYDFSEIERHYCVISLINMRRRLLSRGLLHRSTVSCFDFHNCATFRQVVSVSRGMRSVRTTKVTSVNEMYPTAEVLRSRIIPLLTNADDTLIILGAGTSFTMRRGLAENAAIYGLLRPSVWVAQKVKQFLNHSFGPRGRFFAVHKRHLEMTCNDYVTRSLSHLRTHFGVALIREREQVIRAQCNISIPYLATLHTSLGLRLFSYPLFLAHDRQDPYTVPQLKKRGARVYEKEHYAQYEDCAYGLCALAVDYFVMTEAEYFGGNAVSSVSNNVCFARLGRGKACHGTEPALIRMLSHDVLAPYPLPG